MHFNQLGAQSKSPVLLRESSAQITSSVSLFRGLLSKFLKINPPFFYECLIDLNTSTRSSNSDRIANKIFDAHVTEKVLLINDCIRSKSCAIRSLHLEPNKLLGGHFEAPEVQKLENLNTRV
jgi:hypothetical protein